MFNFVVICSMILGICLYKYIITKQLSLMMRYNIIPVLKVKYKLEFILKYMYPILATLVIINTLIK